MMNTERYMYYRCKNVMYHKDLNNNNVYKKYKINLSTYIPPIIKKIINSIHNKFNYQYIVCPFYNNLYNYQIGITETSKVGETNYDTIIRGINEECGLNNISWDYNDTYDYKQRNKNWFGICVSNNNYSYKPQSILNNNIDDKKEKVAVIIHNKIDNLLKIFSDTKKNEIKSDDISGLGFISIYDCKQIINNQLL
jgi:hypothetical protein